MKKLLVSIVSIISVVFSSSIALSEGQRHNHDCRKDCKCMAMNHSEHGSHMGQAMPSQDDIKAIPSCKYCGMDREKFSHARMLIEYEDGSSTGTCSIHCTAIELSVNLDKTIKSILVGDYNTKKLIDAEKAIWVMGGSKMGVMTKRAKWAFEKKEDAEAFIKENGGKTATFEEALKAAYEDMYEDIKMIREKRKMMRQKMEHRHEHKH
ncbi:MAG: nitrous oxide reductase accessory protein NosL [Thermodesulfovibrionales bacterium]